MEEVLMNARIIKHYDKDPVTGELGGDYHYVTVEIYGRKVKNYGDYYHEKGFERAQAFIEGYAHANNIKAVAITHSEAEVEYGTV
jgi:hypothetical protein